MHINFQKKKGHRCKSTRYIDVMFGTTTKVPSHVNEQFHMKYCIPNVPMHTKPAIVDNRITKEINKKQPYQE